MAKYIGPKSKIARRFGEAIYGPDKVLSRRNFPPGQHGQNRRRGKLSEYGKQFGIPTPVNDLLTVMVKAIQGNYDKQYLK